jgi:GNAT superfamily N-acetyltransferase
MTVTVRPPRADEAPAIAAVHVAAWHETYTGLLPDEVISSLTVERRIRLWEYVLANPLWTAAVAESDGEIVGLAAVHPSPEEPAPRPLELGMIYLLAAHQGSGAGQALLDAVLGDAPASLWVLEDNPRARAFYARNGFVPDGVDRREDGSVELRLVR